MDRQSIVLLPSLEVRLSYLGIAHKFAMYVPGYEAPDVEGFSSESAFPVPSQVTNRTIPWLSLICLSTPQSLSDIDKKLLLLLLFILA